MELSQIRQKIDALNADLLRLFEERMRLCAQVASYKQENGMEVFVPSREVEILNRVRADASPELAEYDVSFFNCLLALSRQYQAELLHLDAAPGIPAGIQTERLRLIPLEKGAAPAVYSITSDPEAVRYLRFDVHTRPEEAEALVQELSGGGNLAYTILKKDGEFVGVFAFKAEQGEPESYALTIFLAKKHWGQGYCTEVSEMAKNMARDILHARFLRAFAVSGNAASCRALEHAGFRLAEERSYPDLEGSLRVYEYDLPSQEPQK